MNTSSDGFLLDVENLKMHFPIVRGFRRRVIGHVKAVDGVDFHIAKGETLGLVGESGSGKTTVGRCIVRLVDPTEGRIGYQHGSEQVDIASLERKQFKRFRKDIQMIFQDPYSSLNPRMTVGDIVAEPLAINGVGTSKERKDRVKELLDKVGLRGDQLTRYPHQFSGGQRQRIGIARALALNPKLIVCDEPVSALDVSIQAQVLNLLSDLQGEFGLTFLFIAHNLSVVEYVSDRIMVMYLGKVAEVAPAASIYKTPKHPYTEALIAAIPKAHSRSKRKRIILEGSIPSPSNPPSGCRFHTRCKYVQDVCKKEVPPLLPVAGSPSTFSSCHFANELELQGYTD